MSKTVVITGAASGMGLSDTRKFLENNWNVVMADFDEKNGSKVATELQKEFPKVKVLFQKVDVSDENSVQTLADAVLENFDSVDNIINNAGVFVSGTLHELDSKTWDRVMEIDVKSIFLMTKAFIPTMIKQGEGVITIWQFIALLKELL